MKLESKLVEIRDRATCIPALAIRMVAENAADPAQYWAIHCQSGYPRDGSTIILMKLYGPEAHADPYEWGTSRTMTNAHRFITREFDKLTDGQVVDVRVILGEEQEPAKPDRLDAGWTS